MLSFSFLLNTPVFFSVSAASLRCRNSCCIVVARFSIESSSSTNAHDPMRSRICLSHVHCVQLYLALDSLARYLSSIAVSDFFSCNRSLRSAIFSFLLNTSRSNALRSSLSSCFSRETVSLNSFSLAKTTRTCSVIFSSFSTTSSKELKLANCSSCAVLTSRVSKAPRSPWIFCILPSKLGLSCKFRVSTLVLCRNWCATRSISSSFAWNLMRLEKPFIFRRS
mmetsp:Transcript_75019/g.121912  ORF Transcript_75019/g.121912 Transcript_75019/m.121912 type:complete len:223 (-) Transcript_75019:2-670(-)